MPNVRYEEHIYFNQRFPIFMDILEMRHIFFLLLFVGGTSRGDCALGFGACCVCKLNFIYTCILNNHIFIQLKHHAAIRFITISHISHHPNFPHSCHSSSLKIKTRAV